MNHWDYEKYTSLLYWGCIVGLLNLIIGLYLYLYSSQSSLIDSYVWSFYQIVNLLPLTLFYGVFKIGLHIDLLKYSWSLLLFSFLWPFTLFACMYLLLSLWHQTYQR